MTEPQTEERFVDLPGGQVYTRTWHPADPKTDIPLVLMHDTLGCVALWRDFPDKLAHLLGQSVVAYDRLGFGRSTARVGLPSPDFMHEEAEIHFPALRCALGIERYALFGYSVGGGMALLSAAADPGCLAVVSESAQAFVEPLTLDGVRRARDAFRDARRFERLLPWHGDKARWVLDAWTELWLSPAMANWTLAPDLPRVRCPVLALHGDRDDYGSAAFPELIGRQVSGPSEIFLLQDCGHMPHREQEETVLAKVADFLRRHGRSPRPDCEK